MCIGKYVSFFVFSHYIVSIPTVRGNMANQRVIMWQLGVLSARARDLSLEKRKIKEQIFHFKNLANWPCQSKCFPDSLQQPGPMDGKEGHM